MSIHCKIIARTIPTIPLIHRIIKLVLLSVPKILIKKPYLKVTPLADAWIRIVIALQRVNLPGLGVQ